MNWKKCKCFILEDYCRLRRHRGVVYYVLTNASFKVTFWFRIGSYLKGKSNILAKILYFIVLVLYRHSLVSR